MRNRVHVQMKVKFGTRKVNVAPELERLMDKIAISYDTTKFEAFCALWEAEEVFVVDGGARLITPGQSDGHVAA